MVQPYVVAIASLPLVARLIALVVPEAYLEPYASWSPDSLNLRPGETSATTAWRNMGYWEVSRHLFPELMARMRAHSPTQQRHWHASSWTSQTHRQAELSLVRSEP